MSRMNEVSVAAAAVAREAAIRAAETQYNEQAGVRRPVDRFLEWQRRVGEAAMAFESRWTMLALARVDAALAENLAAQQDQYHQASFLGVAKEVAIQGAGLVRGYSAAVKAMETAKEPDDAYRIGRCPKTGTVVAIGEQKAALERVRVIAGESAIWVTPDEVASMFGAIEALKTIAAIKRQFPGAEIMHRYPTEPDQVETGMVNGDASPLAEGVGVPQPSEKQLERQQDALAEGEEGDQ